MVMISALRAEVSQLFSALHEGRQGGFQCQFQLRIGA